MTEEDVNGTTLIKDGSSNSKHRRKFNSFMITSNYKSVNLWLCAENGECVKIVKMTPNKSLPRQEKYGVIKRFLDQFGIDLGEYKNEYDRTILFLF